MRIGFSKRPVLAIALRVLGAALILVSLVFPRLGEAGQVVQSASAAKASAAAAPLNPLPRHDEDGGECGEDSQVESIDCGEKLAQMESRLDEPLAITLLRKVGLHTLNMSERACTELLTDIWSQESCAAQSRECGKMHTGAPPAPAPKLASSSSSGQSFWAGLGLGGASTRRLPRHASERGPSSRDLEPPVPPPKLLSH